MAKNLAPALRQRYLDANGNPLAGGKLYSYQAGTSTPQATYTDSTGGVPNANPVVLDANGEANVWLDDSLAYKFILKDSADVTQWTVDNVAGGPSVPDLGIGTGKIANDAVTSDKLRDDPVTDSNRAVTTNHIRDLAVTTAKIASSAVTTEKIGDSQVTTAKIADGNITQAKLAALNYSLSESCSTGFSTTAGLNDVPNLTASFTVLSRPVMLMLVNDGSGNRSEFTEGGANTYGVFKRGTTEIGRFHIAASGALDAHFPVAFDVPGEGGPYVYKVQVNVNNRVDWKCWRLLVIEL